MLTRLKYISQQGFVVQSRQLLFPKEMSNPIKKPHNCRSQMQLTQHRPELKAREKRLQMLESKAEKKLLLKELSRQVVFLERGKGIIDILG